MKRAIHLVSGLAFILCAASAAAQGNSAINTTVPCNSNKLAIRPMADGKDKAFGFLKQFPQLSEPKPKDDYGDYTAEMASPEAVNNFLADLNANHAGEVVDLFQVLQCDYKLF